MSPLDVFSGLWAPSLKAAMVGMQFLISSLPLGPIRAWMPDSGTVWSDLTILLAEDPGFGTSSFQGMPLRGSGSEPWFWSLKWSRFTAQHWEVPLVAVAAYLLAIPLLKWHVAKYGKWDVRNVAFYWNAGLSLFSWCGVFACVPVLLDGLVENGFYFTTCAPAKWYGNDLSGFFVMLFVYSKLAELMDTVLLLLAQKPVIALQWWHHSTVLLYCWHSYSASIATGIWFAAMNYSVHSVMYGYFAVTATKYRKLVTPFAIFITLAQLLQMLVGMYVTIKAVLYQAQGQECHVNKTNSVLGLLMYLSYFVLFFKLFIDNYCLQAKKSEPSVPAKKRPTTMQLVRKVTEDTLKDASPSMIFCEFEETKEQ
ncbi:unnamed protein product [Polarella glacialis]|uniref:Elongation of fatty acids protein n=1 Tax=Polarella glacialis TaxID=89957 RepID=A0A813EHA4_POLGL|nr:unnamed protein product [Polarella glacialis]CAE8610742.1 unnamed protein product [Polarella glacialis]CAE8728300.1 unnamed protein product [Polarella glacialis]